MVECIEIDIRFLPIDAQTDWVDKGTFELHMMQLLAHDMVSSGYRHTASLYACFVADLKQGY